MYNITFILDSSLLLGLCNINYINKHTFSTMKPLERTFLEKHFDFFEVRYAVNIELCE